ncbi:hypothetical protein J6590_028345 [Homalodisca vitripennis]|nr:hypothetical protein J6590_028345 [Homalodisca vitripennis]
MNAAACRAMTSELTIGVTCDRDISSWCQLRLNALRQCSLANRHVNRYSLRNVAYCWDCTGLVTIRLTLFVTTACPRTITLEPLPYAARSGSETAAMSGTAWDPDLLLPDTHYHIGAAAMSGTAWDSGLLLPDPHYHIGAAAMYDTAWNPGLFLPDPHHHIGVAAMYDTAWNPGLFLP